MRRELLGLLSLGLLLLACSTAEPIGTGGAGGVQSSGGADTSGGGAGHSGGESTSNQTLRSLECEGIARGPWVVVSSECMLIEDVMSVFVRGEPGSPEGLVRVTLGGLEAGTRLTEYGGSMFRHEAVWGQNSVSLGSEVCFGPSSVYTPDPCEIELLALERGEVQAGGAGGTAVEEGSRVRLRVACPDGLYAPGGDDYGPTLVELIPEEFELEARDCIVAME